MEDTPEYDFLPKLVPCPVCKGLNGEDSPDCKHCGTAVKVHLERIKARDDARKARDEEERQRQESWRINTYIFLGIVAFIVVGCIINANTPPQPKRYFSDSGTVSLAPGTYTFQASGKVKVQYSCSLNAGSATAQFSLVDLKTSKTVWSKQVKCVTGSYEHPLPEYTDTIQLKSSNYEVGSKMSGDGTWSMTITQA